MVRKVERKSGFAKLKLQKYVLLMEIKKTSECYSEILNTLL